MTCLGSVLIDRSVRALREEPYSQKEAELAVGLRTDNGRPEKMHLDDEISAAQAAIVSAGYDDEPVEEDQGLGSTTPT